MAIGLQKAIHAVFDNLKQRTVQLPSGIERQFLLDDQNGHYQLLHIGWDGLKAVRNILVHIDLKSDLVWVQCDYTEYQSCGFAPRAGFNTTTDCAGFSCPV